MQQNNDVFSNWICASYAMLREREDIMMQRYMDLMCNVSYHEGVEASYSMHEGAGEYPHKDVLQEERDKLNPAREEYFKARNQTNQMAHFMLSLLLINK